LVAPHRSVDPIYDDDTAVNTACILRVAWPEDVARPRVGVVQDGGTKPYWTKYRRFLRENSFDYRFVDIHASSWTEDLAGLDILVWRVGSRPHEIEEARKKIFYMEEFAKLLVLPSARAASLYEDKVLQSWVLAHVGATVPNTIVSFSETDAIEQVSALGPEVVWKIATGAGSAGVERLRADRARRAVRRAFSIRGRRTYWPHLNQKGYVYLQSLERDLTVDVRVFVIGPILLGYYRMVPRGDFRASGMGIEIPGALPAEAMEEAWRIATTLDVGAMSVDFISDPELRRFKAIEMSAFNQLDSAHECQVDGVPGAYVRLGQGNYVFQPGRVWVPELALARALARMCGLDADKLLVDAVTSGQEPGGEPAAEMEA
jgi:glutathione synthase/RimK-type ligase-like ATP-grasp enzyme